MPELCKFSMFLDSGAFGAWKQKRELPLKDYIAFIKRHKHLLSAYVAMDVIPGQSSTKNEAGLTIGGMRTNTRDTVKDVEKSAQKSFDNLRRMQDAGLDPIPVFHQGEDYKWLVRMIDDGCAYIGISPYLKSHRNEIVKFLDESFSIVCDAKGHPRVKTHGFGVTSPTFMSRVPWYSVDSTSWNLAAAYGEIKIPQYIGDKPNYCSTPITLDVSSRHDVDKRYKHDRLQKWAVTNPLYYNHVLQFLNEVGLTVMEVGNAYHLRLIATIKYYQKVEAACQNVVFKHRVGMVTVNGHKGRELAASKHKRSFRLQYAVLPSNGVTNGALNFCGVTNRLISYLDLLDWGEDAIERYVATGLPCAPGRRIPKQSWSYRSSYLIMRRLSLERRANAVQEADVVSNDFTLFLPDEGDI